MVKSESKIIFNMAVILGGGSGMEVQKSSTSHAITECTHANASHSHQQENKILPYVINYCRSAARIPLLVNFSSRQIFLS